MTWSILILSVWFLLGVVWLVRKRKVFRPIGFALSLIGLSGFLVLIACSYISTLPSNAPLSTVTGLATNPSSFALNRHNSDFILIEWKTGRRILFHTTIDGPWVDQPVLVTYVDDGRFLPSVVRIEILGEDQVPTWHVEKGHSGWIGTAEAKRRAPLLMYSIGFLLLLLFVLAPFKRTPDTDAAGPEMHCPVGT
jgi:hypothetical protein